MPHRVADILLRPPAARPLRLHWPAPGPTPPGLVVLITAGPADDAPTADAPTADATALANRLGAVVLAVPPVPPGSVHAALGWAADHAAELGADPTRLAVVAVGGAADLAAHLARRVRREGWPPLRAVVPVRPGDDPAAALLAAGWVR